MAYRRLIGEQTADATRSSQIKQACTCNVPAPRFGLSPPGNSKLAKRRAEQGKKKGEDSPSNEQDSPLLTMDTINVPNLYIDVHRKEQVGGSSEKKPSSPRSP